MTTFCIVAGTSPLLTGMLEPSGPVARGELRARSADPVQDAGPDDHEASGDPVGQPQVAPHRGDRVRDWVCEGAAVPVRPGPPLPRGEASQWSGYIPEGFIS
jgi:hypothetical protein